MWSLVVSAYMRSQKKFQTGDHKKDKEENELFLAFAYSLSDLTALFKMTHYYYFTAENAFSTCLTVVYTFPLSV